MYWYKHVNGKRQKVSYCSACRRDNRRKRPEESLLHLARQRAKRLGLPCTITRADIIVPAVCPVLGIPIGVARGTVSDGSPSIDRVRPELGYVPGNVRVISFKANTIKSNATADDLRRVLQYVEQSYVGTLPLALG